MSKEPKRNVYVGHRYVPKIMGEWDKQKTYEGLSIVTYQGNSYTSKKRVPVGIDITNEEYWAVTGNYNAQVDQYRQEVRNMGDYVDSEINDLKNYVNNEIENKANQSDLDETNRQLADNTNKIEILNKKTDGIFVNVKEFGAKGDGIADDTSSIQDAINSINTGVVYIPAGTYIISGTLTIKPNTKIIGAGIRSTIIKTTTSEPAFRVQNALIGSTQMYTVSDLKVIGNTSMNDCVFDLRGSQYGVLENIEIWGVENPDGTTKIPAKGFRFDRGAASFVGYMSFKNIYVIYCEYGLYGEGNIINIQNGAYNRHSQYCIYLNPGNSVKIHNVECAHGEKGGIFFKGTGLDVKGCWFEYNANKTTGQYDPNDVEVDPTSKNVSIGENVFDNPYPGVFHGETPRKGYEPFHAITGNGEVALQNILPNGDFQFVNSNNEPYGYYYHNPTIQSFQKLTSDLPPRYKTGIRMIYKSEVPKLYRLFDVVPGEVLSFVGWVRISSGLGHCVVGIFKDQDSSSGQYFSIHAGSTPRNKWHRVQVRYVVPDGVTKVRVGCNAAYGGTPNVDYVDFTGFSVYRGEHAFFDSHAPITSHGGEIWSQDFKIGGKRHGWGTEAPTIGTWNRGDIVYNINPSPGGNIGWVCVSGGTPGTWKEFGLIES